MRHIVGFARNGGSIVRGAIDGAAVRHKVKDPEALMPELYYDVRPADQGFGARIARGARRAAALALAVVGLVAALAAASVVALAAIAIAVIIAAGVGVMWLIARLSRPRRPASEDIHTLEARKGPRGWTVETRRYSF